MLKNVGFTAGTAPLEAEAVKRASRAAEAQLNGKGRLLLRPSGTEPLIRVMVECEDEALLARVVDDMVDTIAAAGA